MPFGESFYRRAPSTPRLVRSLRRLCREIDARWPERATAADGWIGDDPHSRRVSDHNPDAAGLVHALDVTCRGAVAQTLVAAAVGHSATAYVIYAGQIWSRRVGFAPAPYKGPDPHTSHVHISVRHTKRAERSRGRWLDG